MTTPATPAKSAKKLKRDIWVRIVGGDNRVFLEEGTQLQKTEKTWIREDSVPTVMAVYEVLDGLRAGTKVYRADNDLENFLTSD